MFITHHKRQQTFLYNLDDVTKSKAAPNDQDLISHRLVCWQQTQHNETKIQIKKATLLSETVRSSAQVQNNQISATKSILIGVQTWGYGTDYKLDQVDFTAQMSFLSTNQRESTLNNQTPFSANTWSPWQH